MGYKINPGSTVIVTRSLRETQLACNYMCLHPHLLVTTLAGTEDSSPRLNKLLT